MDHECFSVELYTRTCKIPNRGESPPSPPPRGSARVRVHSTAIAGMKNDDDKLEAG